MALELHPAKVRESADFRSVMKVFLKNHVKDGWCFEHIFSFFYACGLEDGFNMDKFEMKLLCKDKK